HRPGEPAARRYHGEAGVQYRLDILGDDRRGTQCGGVQGAVQAVAHVAEPGVLPGQVGRAGRIARTGPAVEVAADLRADPLPVRVVPGGGGGRVDPEQKVAVRHPFGGEHTAAGQQVQPRLGHVVGGEPGTGRLQQVQGHQRVVEVVVL